MQLQIWFVEIRYTKLNESGMLQWILENFCHFWISNKDDSKAIIIPNGSMSVGDRNIKMTSMAFMSSSLEGIDRQTEASLMHIYAHIDTLLRLSFVQTHRQIVYSGYLIQFSWYFLFFSVLIIIIYWFEPINGIIILLLYILVNVPSYI